ncbi:MAG: TetR/AcrR family transcriptional regulator [Elusimicrobiales bacterium]|nr:TetR/AcrR family transcriptional regulator [Elusimicrobiales bacterium]
MKLTTKDRLHEAALESYSRIGAHNTSFQHLADSLGITQAAIYKYYRSKDDLMTGAILYAADRGRDFILNGENPRDPALKRLKFQITKNLDFCLHDRRNSVALLVMHYYASCIPAVLKLHEEMNRRRTERIAVCVQQAVREGTVPAGTDIDRVSDQIHSLLLGEMVKTYLWPAREKAEARAKKLWSAVSAILGL